MNKSLKADLMLVVVTLCWGASYYLMNVSLGDLEPFTLNAYRFLGAFIVGGILGYKKLKNVNKTTLKYSVILGIILVFVYIGSTFGVKNTSLSNSGFLCALTVIFVPIINFIVRRKIPEKKILFAVSMSFVGIMLLTLKNDFSLNTDNILGDAFCLMCAVFYSTHLLTVEKAVSHEEVNAFQIGVFQLGVTGVFMLILSILFETPHLPSTPTIWFSVSFLAIFCTGVAFIVQTIAQQYTTASHVGIIFTLEPVFAGIVAFFLAGEVLSAQAYFGAALLIGALFVTEMNINPFQKKEQKDIEASEEKTG